MRQETILKTYKYFTELTVEQQNKVLEKYYNINEDCWDYNYKDLESEFINKLETLGYSNIKIQYSGFYSQGDGLSFTAKHGDHEIYRFNYHYSHSNSVTSDNKDLLLKARKLMNDFYKEIKTQYEYLYSKDAIVDTILANEYEFDIDTLKIA